MKCAVPVTVSVPRRRLSATVSPAAYRLNSSESIGTLSTGFPFTDVTTSLIPRPAVSAALSGMTSDTMTPDVRSKPSPAASAGVMVCMLKPTIPRCRCPYFRSCG